MYISENYTQTAIAELLGIEPKTITDWKIKFKWDDRKRAEAQTDEAILQKLKEALDEALNQKPLNADNVSKLTASIARMSDGKVLASKASSVLNIFMDYLMLIGQVDLAKKIALISPVFVDHLLDYE
jgi:predicted transcriptional regulator